MATRHSGMTLSHNKNNKKLACYGQITFYLLRENIENEAKIYTLAGLVFSTEAKSENAKH